MGGSTSTLLSCAGRGRTPAISSRAGEPSRGVGSLGGAMVGAGIAAWAIGGKGLNEVEGRSEKAYRRAAGAGERSFAKCSDRARRAGYLAARRHVRLAARHADAATGARARSASGRLRRNCGGRASQGSATWRFRPAAGVPGQRIRRFHHPAGRAVARWRPEHIALDPDSLLEAGDQAQSHFDRARGRAPGAGGIGTHEAAGRCGAGRVIEHGSAEVDQASSLASGSRSSVRTFGASAIAE